MSDQFLSAEKPKSDTDNGWIEYALLLGWEELPAGYEYVTDNATDELATLRAQVERLTRRLNWIRINPNDGVALRFALEATDKEIDDVKHLITESEK